MKFILRIFPISFLLIFFSINGNSQNINHICATDQHANMDQYLKNIDVLRSGIVHTRGAITYVPVNYVLGARTNGTGRVNEALVLDMHCHLNERYADMEIQFYIKDGTFTYINNDQFYDEHARATAIMTFNADPNAVNVFLPKSADPLGADPGTVLGYYSPQRDWLVMRSTQAKSRSETLPHEMGHLFSLMHPHFGWDAVPFDRDHANWPTAPTISPGGIPTEYVDRRNCLTGGDMLCDTPSDYNPNAVGSGNCLYSDGAKDPSGTSIDPDETLIMAYFDDNCVERFSDDQQSMIKIDLNSNRRAKFRRDNYTPPATMVAENIWVNPPSINSGNVTIDWADVSGASHYLLEYATNKFFLNGTTTFATVAQSSFEFTNLEAGKQYFYRIRPFNPAVTCSRVSKIFSFEVSGGSVSSADDISFVKNFSVFPNPAKRDGQISVSIVSGESFEGEVSVFDLAGKEIFAQKRFFAQGDNQFPIEMDTDMSGVFILFIKSDAGILKKKIVVTD